MTKHFHTFTHSTKSINKSRQWYKNAIFAQKLVIWEQYRDSIAVNNLRLVDNINNLLSQKWPCINGCQCSFLTQIQLPFVFLRKQMRKRLRDVNCLKMSLTSQKKKIIIIIREREIGFTQTKKNYPILCVYAKRWLPKLYCYPATSSPKLWRRVTQRHLF